MLQRMLHDGRSLPVSVFIETISVLVYLLLARPVGLPAEWTATLFGAVFGLGRRGLTFVLDGGMVATVALRSALIFLAAFSLTWFGLALWRAQA